GAPPIEDPRIWVVRGRALAALRRHDESQACYERALTLAPDDLAIRLAMLPTAADLDQRARQLAEMDEFLRSHPEQPEATRRTLAQRHFDLGESLCHAKRDSDARDAYGRAVELAPAFKEACEKKGSKSLALFRYREAIEEFSQVIDLDPKHASSWCSRGFAYRHLGRVDAALADNSRAVELASDVAEHWYHRGVDYAHLGQHDKAIADFSEAVKIDPMHVWAFSDRGLAHEDLNEFDGAVADYSKALELAADHHATINNLAWLLANCSDPRFRDAGRATELAKRAVDLAPRDGGFWNTLGAAHYRAGDWKGAVLALTKATELRQGGTLSDWLFLAMAERRLENKEAARRWYDQATAWIQRNKPLAKDLERFRVEAAELLGGG
ncbi:MAG TPA: tetratricopeptide repeat protein, partial [Pirellulales bacterium]|nr:tetratricopeptide repeat protein [Pirellulales bacterium]